YSVTQKRIDYTISQLRRRGDFVELGRTTNGERDYQRIYCSIFPLFQIVNCVAQSLFRTAPTVRQRGGTPFESGVPGYFDNNNSRCSIMQFDGNSEFLI